MIDNGSNDSTKKNQTVGRRSIRSGENKTLNQETPKADLSRRRISEKRETPSAKENKSTQRLQNDPIKYKICLDNTEMVDTPNISPKCRNRRIEPTTYLYSDTMKRRLRRRERAEAQAVEHETLSNSLNISCSNSKSSSRASSVVPVQAWYASHFAC